MSINPNENNPEEVPEVIVASEAEEKPYAEAGDVVVTEAVAVPVLPTQVAQPNRASWRTALFATITALPIVNLAILSLQQILVDYGYTETTLPVWAWGILNGAVVISGIMAKWVNSVALLPRINDWLTSHGVGPTPAGKHAAR